MKWTSLFFLYTCLLMQKLLFGKGEGTKEPEISVKKTGDIYDFTCSGGIWKKENKDPVNNLQLGYKDEDSGHYDCVDKNDNMNVLRHITIKFRTCENCIELDSFALSAVIVGNLLATFLIACAVYSITGQPKGKTFSGNKASDKVNLITNGDGDTYQRLTPGQNSEYSGLVRKK